MKEHPILFSGEMVRAILDGRKTQTRRVIKPHKHCYPGDRWWVGEHPNGGWWAVDIPEGPTQRMIDDTVCLGRDGFKCPYGQPGDRLWVRETWCMAKDMDDFISLRGLNAVLPFERKRRGYLADGRLDWHGKTRPSIHMPRWASRITLEIVGVRVERVQEMCLSDAIAEGVIIPKHVDHSTVFRRNFQITWNTLNAKRGYGWEQNPWVWIIDFKVLK